ncbi:MAG: VanZ family protein [bacterium]
MFRNGSAWILPVFWAIALFALSSIPDFTTKSLAITLSDKIWHIIAYLPLGFWLHYAIEQKPGPFASAPANWAVFLGSLYGFVDEFHQYFVPGRFLDAHDLLANTAGVLSGTVLFLLYRKIVFRQKENTS